MRTLRLLVVEDTQERIDWFARRVPPHVRLVVARRAGGAMGLLGRDPPGTYAGVLLDHDLGGDKNGADVARVMAQRLRPRVPVLVHTNSPNGGAAMVRILDAAGFDVTRIVFEELTAEAFEAWLEEVFEDAESS